MTKERKRFLLTVLLFGILTELLLFWQWRVQERQGEEEPNVIVSTNDVQCAPVVAPVNTGNGAGSTTNFGPHSFNAERYIWETWDVPKGN